MIVVRVQGGLGNQMFQFACGRALAQQRCDDLSLDLTAYRCYRLHAFGLRGFRCAIVEAPSYLRAAGRLSSISRRLGISPSWYFRLLGMRRICEEGDLRYQPRLFEVPGSAYLDGYWQSARYFEGRDEVIREDFSLVRPLADQLRDRRERLSVGHGMTVSLHVRRGDYVTDKSANTVHGTLDEDYYQRAVDYLVRILGRAFRLVVFSDDIAWARDNLRLHSSMTYVEADVRFPQVDMQLMASCDHHIIANSSFSWWGAWLNPSPTKIVVAPARWFRSPSLCADDICPADWIRV